MFLFCSDAEENDSFVPQLVASAEAAVKELQRRGVSDQYALAPKVDIQKKLQAVERHPLVLRGA